MNIDKELYEYLQQFLTTERKEKFAKNIANRTKHITVILENIYHRPNASAVIRTCECFGLQTIHFIDDFGFFQANKNVVKGSAKWTNIYHYHSENDNFANCINKLKGEGYKIVATTLKKDSYKQTSLNNIPVGDEKIALMLGTEDTGLSKRAHEVADYYLSLPMYGFTTSFNISVTAAMCLSHFSKRLRTDYSSEVWGLTGIEKESILNQWTLNSIKNVEALTKRFYQDRDESKNN